MGCRHGDYLSIAGNYYCLRSETECSYRDHTRIKEVSIEDKEGKKNQVYQGCNLAHMIENETRITGRMYTPR